MQHPRQYHRHDGTGRMQHHYGDQHLTEEQQILRLVQQLTKKKVKVKIVPNIGDAFLALLHQMPSEGDTFDFEGVEHKVVKVHRTLYISPNQDPQRTAMVREGSAYIFTWIQPEPRQESPEQQQQNAAEDFNS